MGRRFLLLGASANGDARLNRWAVGQKGIRGLEGLRRDTEVGELYGNPITQGSVDRIGGIVQLVPGGGEAKISFRIAAGNRYDDVRDRREQAVRRGPDFFLDLTRHYWRLWVNSVSPLTWSHATFVESVNQLLDHRTRVKRAVAAD